MQIKGLHKSFYSIYKWSRKFELDEKILKERDEAKKPYIEKVQKYEEISKKCKDKDLIFKYSGISRATYFRYKKVIKDIDKGKYMPKKIKNKRKNIKNYTAIDKKIAEIRIESDNIYGRDKIATILRRDHKIFLSASTVGRRMKKLFEQGVIEKYSAKNKPRKPRKFDKHAKRWDYDKWKNVSKPGECIQIDHMSVTVDGKTFKHFAAIDKISKVIVAKVVSNATSNAASKFLDQVMEKMPWSKTIQVDGGSEFMLHFEEKCKQINLELVVLPPKKPKYNGNIERSNRILREEFYGQKKFCGADLKEINKMLNDYLETYNNYRPHSRIGYETPLNYAKMIMEAQSQNI